MAFKDTFNCVGMWPSGDNISTVNTLSFSLSGEEAFERKQSLNVSYMKLPLSSRSTWRNGVLKTPGAGPAVLSWSVPSWLSDLCGEHVQVTNSVTQGQDLKLRGEIQLR